MTPALHRRQRNWGARVREFDWLGLPAVAPEGVEGIPHPVGLNGDRRRVVAERFHRPHAVSPQGDEIDLSVLPPSGTASEIVYLTGFPQPACATAGYPWYGRHWNIGLEPFSSYPTNGLAEAVANGTALELSPGEERAFSLSAEVIARG